MEKSKSKRKKMKIITSLFDNQNKNNNNDGEVSDSEDLGRKKGADNKLNLIVTFVTMTIGHFLDSSALKLSSLTVKSSLF